MSDNLAQFVWEFSDFKLSALNLAERVKEEFNPEELVAVMPHGLWVSSMLSHYLNIPCGMYWPSSKQLILSSGQFGRRILFLDESSSKETLENIKVEMRSIPTRPQWKYAVALVNVDYFNEYQTEGIFDYMCISSKPVHFPYYQDITLV